MRRYSAPGLWKVLPMMLLLLLLTGCWDRLELEEQAYVVVLGLDKAPKNMIAVTFQIANPQVGSSDKGAAQNEPSSDIVTFVSSDILSAKELANSVITRKISFAHLRTVVLNQDLAKTDLSHRVIGASIRDPEMRREINLIVSREKASEFIHNNRPKLETRPHKYYAFMQERWRDTGYVPYSTMNRYFQRIGKDTLFLAIYATAERTEGKFHRNEDSYISGEVPQKSGDPVQIIGSAVFKSGKMIGTLTGEQTRLALFMRRKSLSHSFITTYPDPMNDQYRVTTRLIKDGNTRVEVNTRKEPVEVSVTLPLKVQVLSTPGFVDYAVSREYQALLKEALIKDLESKAKAVITEVQQKYKGEPFLWHLYARKQFMTLQEYEAYDWSKHFADASVQVKVELKLVNFGKQLRSPIQDDGQGNGGT